MDQDYLAAYDFDRDEATPQPTPTRKRWLLLLWLVGISGCGGGVEQVCQVARIIDGDTITCQGLAGRVRLAALDAAEMGQIGVSRDGFGSIDMGLEAALCVAERIGGRVIGLEVQGEDKYGRLLALTTVDDSLLTCPFIRPWSESGRPTTVRPIGSHAKVAK